MRDLVFDIKGRDKTQAAFDSARRNARSFNADLDRTAIGMRAAGVAAKAFAAAFTVTAVADFSRAVRDAVSEASSLAKLADKVGVSTDNLQKMIFGFGQAGVAASDIERGLEQWSKRISEAAHYGGRLADIFRANNVSLTDGSGKLRSNVDIMRDFANLMKNAASDQERMTLANEAFGRSGSDWILALRGGAEGMDELMSRTEAAGGVIDEQLLRKAEEVDDEFDSVARTIEVNVKSAILQAVDATDRFYDRIDDVVAKWNEITALPVPDWLRYLVTLPGASLAPGALIGGAVRRTINGNGSDATPGRSTDPRAWQFGQGMIWTPPPDWSAQTIIPGDGEGENGGRSRRRSAAAAREQASAFDQVIARLREEQQALGLNNAEQRVLAEQRRAGVSATSEQGRAIEALVAQIEAETERLDRLRERQDAINDGMTYLGDLGKEALQAWANGAGDAEEALKKLGIQLALAAAQALLLGQGPLSGLFGSGSIGGAGGGAGLSGIGPSVSALVSNGASSTTTRPGRDVVELRLGPDLEARMLQNSGRQAVQLIRDNNDRVIPEIAQHALSDPRLR